VGETKGLGTKKTWPLSSQLSPSESTQRGNLKGGSSEVARRSCRSVGHSPTLGRTEPAEGQRLQPEKQEPGTPASAL